MRRRDPRAARRGCRASFPRRARGADPTARRILRRSRAVPGIPSRQGLPVRAREKHLVVRDRALVMSRDETDDALGCTGFACHLRAPARVIEIARESRIAAREPRAHAWGYPEEH